MDSYDKAAQDQEDAMMKAVEILKARMTPQELEAFTDYMDQIGGAGQYLLQELCKKGR